jgi:X-X-X-Leu-X-X-Gly heptad repeat protein
MTARTLIRSVLRILQVIDSGETIDDEAQETEAFEALNSLIASVSGSRWMIHEIVSGSHTLVSGTGQYTIGSGGNIDVARPIKINKAWVRDSNNFDHPVKVITQDKYGSIRDKTTQGRPFQLYYDPEYALGKINLYYVPSSAEVLHFDSWKPLSQIAAVGDTLALPLEYERFLKYQLATDLVPEYAKRMPEEVVFALRESRQAIKQVNIQPVPLLRVDNALSQRNNYYDINSDQ